MHRGKALHNQVDRFAYVLLAASLLVPGEKPSCERYRIYRLSVGKAEGVEDSVKLIEYWRLLTGIGLLWERDTPLIPKSAFACPFNGGRTPRQTMSLNAGKWYRIWIAELR
jgi:hypothetical protein